jgi:hypothetical protein
MSEAHEQRKRARRMQAFIIRPDSGAYNLRHHARARDALVVGDTVRVPTKKIETASFETILLAIFVTQMPCTCVMSLILGLICGSHIYIPALSSWLLRHLTPALRAWLPRPRVHTSWFAGSGWQVSFAGNKRGHDRPSHGKSDDVKMIGGAAVYFLVFFAIKGYILCSSCGEWFRVCQR